MVDDLFAELAALPQVEAIALGGSRAGTAFDEKSDYDVYVYVTDPVPEGVRRELLGRYCSRIEVGNHFWEYEDNCVLNEGVDIDLLWRDLDAFGNDVARVVEQCQPSNAYTTCMWHNLRTCKVLYDRDGRLAALKARFDVPYPPALRDAIVERGMLLMRRGMPAMEGQLAKACARGDLVSVNHRTTEFLASCFDVIFAINGLTHPGEKRLLDLAERDCAILPAHFRENVEGLLGSLFSDTANAPVWAARIADELEAVL